MEKIKRHILTIEMHKNRICFASGIFFALIPLLMYSLINKLPNVGWMVYTRHRFLPYVGTLKGSVVAFLILILFIIGYLLMQFRLKMYIKFLFKKVTKAETINHLSE